MLHIALVNPGASDYDKQGRLQGRLNIPLSAEGQTAVQTAAAELRGMGVAAVYTADCQPALQTAEGVARHLGLKAKTLSKLQNVNLGLWEGCLEEEVRRKHPRIYRQWEEMAENVCPPMGETLGQAKVRVKAHLVSLIRKHRDGCIAVVAPRLLLELAAELLHEGDCGTTWSDVNAAESETCRVLTPAVVAPASVAPVFGATTPTATDAPAR